MNCQWENPWKPCSYWPKTDLIYIWWFSRDSVDHWQIFCLETEHQEVRSTKELLSTLEVNKAPLRFFPKNNEIDNGQTGCFLPIVWMRIPSITLQYIFYKAPNAWVLEPTCPDEIWFAFEDVVSRAKGTEGLTIQNLVQWSLIHESQWMKQL